MCTFHLLEYTLNPKRLAIYYSLTYFHELWIIDQNINDENRIQFSGLGGQLIFPRDKKKLVVKLDEC